MPTYKLTYFDGCGQAELSRLLFSAAGVEYEDHRINNEEWQELKPRTPQGTLPVLTIDGDTMLTHSLVIGRYLAREFGLAGVTNLEQAKIDVIIQTTEDMRLLLFKIMTVQEVERAQLKKKFEEEDLPKFLNYFETELEANGGRDDFFFGNSVTAADLAVYDVFEMLVRQNAQLLSKTPRLAANRKRVAELPKIKKYLESRRETDM